MGLFWKLVTAEYDSDAKEKAQISCISKHWNGWLFPSQHKHVHMSENLLQIET